MDSTKKSYSTGWKHFLDYTTLTGIDPTLNVPPPWWTSQSLPYAFQVAAVMGFLAYLAFEKHLAPSSCNSYLSGARFNLLNCGTDLAFLERCVPLRALRSGILLEYRATHAKSDSKHLPITNDMIVTARVRIFNRGTAIELAILLALEVGLCCVMRISEYILVPWSNHHLRACDVQFWFQGKEVLSRILASAVSSAGLPFSALRMVSFHVRSAKNDSEGEGNVITYELGTSRGAIEFFRHLFDWAKDAQPEPWHPFLSYRGEWSLPYAFVNAARKRIASYFGFSPKLFSSHSIRVGGASALAAAAQPDSVIKIVGRWRSLEFVEYIRMCNATYALSPTFADCARAHNANVSDRVSVGLRSSGFLRAELVGVLRPFLHE